MLEIKPFTPTDLDFVAGMAREQDFAPGVGDIEIYANTDRQGIWLAWHDNEPVGCIAAVTYNPSYAFIGLFVVKPEHRGQGNRPTSLATRLEIFKQRGVYRSGSGSPDDGLLREAGFQKDCVTTRQQMLWRSDQSQHPNTTLLHRSDITVVPLREISLEAIQRYDERHKSVHGLISLNCGYATGLETSLWREILRESAMATCAFGPACSRSVKVGGWGPGWRKIPPWHRCY